MAVEQGDAEFLSKLDDRSRKRAREELNELNDKDRELAVQTLRQWVLEQKWLRTPTDFDFLLKFLRVRKFSQLLARETLENYWTVKTKTPEWFRNMDPSDPEILAILRTGAITSPKAYDKEGRRLFMQAFGRLDIAEVKTKRGLDNFFKAMCLVLEWMNTDENVQVNGHVTFIDDSDFSMSHGMTIWSRENIKRMVQFYQNSMPSRVKEVHMYNQSPSFDIIFTLFSPFLKQKIKDRLTLHGRNLVKVYPHVGQDLLPEEYLPDDFKGKTVGTMETVIDEMIADMMRPEFRSYIKELSSGKYGVDLNAKDKDAPVASFRKLNVD